MLDGQFISSPSWLPSPRFELRTLAGYKLYHIWIMYVDVRVFVLLFSHELLVRVQRNVARAPLLSASLAATTLLSSFIEF